MRATLSQSVFDYFAPLDEVAVCVPMKLDGVLVEIQRRLRIELT